MQIYAHFWLPGSNLFVSLVRVLVSGGRFEALGKTLRWENKLSLHFLDNVPWTDFIFCAGEQETKGEKRGHMSPCLEVLLFRVAWLYYAVDHNEVPIDCQELSSDPVGQSGISPLGENSQEL